ncbi:hypothetical protein SASPL_110087 [Salvia splendens]|uniref:Agglutinin domain-containing protein n=1 Tax=Salvia splendens TaxID=180675 RepID=A0A8X9A3W1_SALSN|nr:uncharacterized protein LOC121797797 [Salvia splendens]KAG6425879.1 hypothetical protein SASPL_110087 [Salvia splendens]
MATIILPRSIVIKSKTYSEKGNAYFKADGASVLIGEEDIFSTLVKIESEMATINEKYVNLRFGYFNRYWQQQSGDSNFIVAESDQPQEDVTQPSCTLFEPVKVDDNGAFYLRHVQSGGRVLVDSLTMGFYVDEKGGDDEKAYLTFVDWSTLVKLPPNVSLKGDNGKYLRTNETVLEFESEDRNKQDSSFIVEVQPDGHVEIGQGQALSTRSYWNVSRFPTHFGLITVNPQSVALPERYMFWPIKIDETSIAFRSVFYPHFCCRRVRNIISGELDNSLSASADSITKEAIMEVQESLLSRKIYNVRYQMEYARIFNEVPFVAGTTSLSNPNEGVATVQASITYTDEKSYSFSRSLSLTGGVSSSIEAGVPFITSASITVSYEINGTFEWGETTTTSTSVTATGTVPVPGKSTVIVDYVGTRGTCNIPYSYTQQDTSSVDGKIVNTILYDGIYSGVSYYNFSFSIREIKSL